jgi:putative CocE/NonD family hydrolase
LHTTQVSRSEEYKMIVEKDVAIPTRDGAILYADVFRPDGDNGRVPALLNITIYQKDAPWLPPADLEEKANPYMCWETVNPVWWVPRGYACVRIDSRGSGKSPGRSNPSSYEESLDYYDAIEWIAKRPWCTGKIGLAGISYHASAQWRVANLRPPSLKAILPWEGRADQYRDQIYHGGIFAMGFITTWHTNQTAHHLFGDARTYNPDAFRNNMLWECMNHSLDSDYWRRCSAEWDRIDVPLFSVGNWSGFSMHLRGNTEGYVNAASKHKKLRIHTGTHFHPFHSEEGREDQVRWFDYWLKGVDNGVMKEPPVKLQIRTGGNARPYEFRFENEWPVARTQWTKWYLKAEGEPSSEPDAVEGRLVSETPAESRSITYAATVPTRAGIAPGSGMSASAASPVRTGVTFESMPMAEPTEITGPLMMRLWVSSTSEDMDIFVTLRNVGPDGKDVWERGQHGQPVPLTKGWLRASHRKLDTARTLPYRPYHAHDERRPLKPGEPVECEVEIWPTCIVLDKGHRLRVDIQPRDGVGSAPYTHYVAAYNAFSKNTIYTGGDRASYLLVPIVPARRS